MAPKPIEQREQALYLFYGVEREPGVRSGSNEIRLGRHQSTSSQLRDRTSSGTTRFQRVTSLPGRRLGSR